MGRLILLETSPRVAPGLLSRDAWTAIDEAPAILCADRDDPLAIAVGDAGGQVATLDGPEGPQGPQGPQGREAADVAREIVRRATAHDVVWLGGALDDPGLTDAIAAEVSSLEDPPDVELLVGSWDVEGSRLLDVVAAMDRLRSPGGCPWDAEQTHESLAGYLVEETFETLDAIESGDQRHLAEELGDVLLQVVFHARVAQDADDAADRFDIDDVAGHLVAKLVRRHPHVFASGTDAADGIDSPEAVERAWEEIKAAERGGTAEEDVLAGVPDSLPVELAAAKVAARIRRRDLVVDEAAHADLTLALTDLAAAQKQVGLALRALALSARPAGAPGRD